MSECQVALSVPDTDNIGDYVQAISIKNFLPPNTILVDRERLAYKGTFIKPVKLVINGWFAHNANDVFPVSDMASDIFVIGFHLDHGARDYFRDMQSNIWRELSVKIGARDSSTLEYLHKIGYYNSYFSGCPTIHIRPMSQRIGTGLFPVVVDLPNSVIPAKYLKNAKKLSAMIPGSLSIKEKMELAQKYIDYLYTNASILFTSRIHAALPALGMGIPVIFYGDIENIRLKILTDLGLKAIPFPTGFPKCDLSRKVWLLVKYISSRSILFEKAKNITPMVLDMNYKISSEADIRKKVYTFISGNKD